MKKYVDDETFQKMLEKIMKDERTVSFNEIFKKYIELRENIFDENDFQYNLYKDAFTNYLSSKIDYAISYIKDSCTASEFSWLSEIFDDVAEKTHSLDFINALEGIAKKYPEETAEYNLLESIASAKALI
ncbi:MAG: hypothetical protein MJ184_12555 [Treponema sp.]|uniref:hypothetical protein n=1 Tax=Treponema sp. TaxID=166 RepID=UPI00298DB4EB|nr:hypothetical protein [Treponema sp.]MCQ2053034.1 hypothetical protein [archaeon]MCQ2602184.1 hypothetical protein [Treponema sp.]